MGLKSGLKRLRYDKYRKIRLLRNILAERQAAGYKLVLTVAERGGRYRGNYGPMR